MARIKSATNPKNAGRRPAANPRKERLTILVTPNELTALQVAADAGFEGNISSMVRQLVFQAISIPASAPANSAKE